MANEIPKAPPFDISKVPAPVPPHNPVRHAVYGVTDTIESLKAHIGQQDFHDGLKAFLTDELSKIKTTAATLHLHDVENPDGGFNVHITMSPFRLGAPV